MNERNTVVEKMEYIVNWMKNNRPEVLETFHLPAEEKDFVFLEKIINQKLPKDFKAFYAYMNGQDCSAVFSSAIIEPKTEGIYSISKIAAEFKTLNHSMEQIQGLYQLEVEIKNVQAGIKANYWNKKWLPIAGVGNGNYYLMDLDPDITGEVGQIIHYDHEGPIITIIANSFKEWIEAFILTLLN